MSAYPRVRLLNLRPRALPAPPLPRSRPHSTSTGPAVSVSFLASDATGGSDAHRRLPRPTVPVIGDQDAADLARAVAILAEGAQLRHAAALAHLSLEAAAAAADELARRGILAAGTPLRFVDRRARAAAYEAIPVALRGVRHGDAARMLADEGADPDVVCSHLLEAEPAGSLDVVSRLRSAAERARSHGRVELAIRYLSRAVEETAAVDAHRRVRHELGCAARVVRMREAAGHMRSALELCDDHVERTRIAGDLAEVLLFGGARDAARQAAEQAASDDGLQLALDAYDARRVGRADGHLAGLLATARAGGGSRLCGVLSGVLAWRGEAAELVRPLSVQCLDTVRHEWHEGDALSASQALLCCSLLEEPEASRELIEHLDCIARDRGSVTAASLAAAHGAILHARAGALGDAEAALRRLVELDREHAVALMLPPALCLGADALLERPDLAADLATAIRPSFGDETVEGAMLHELRGRIALAGGRSADARRELGVAAGTYEALHLCSARGTTWRSALALALAAGDGHARARARELAARELADARRHGSHRAIAVALRAGALLTQGARAIADLEEAVAILDESPARLEHARALVDLGAALRRANRRAAARAPLRAGLDAAERCGAHRLRERALVELHATGARPRRAILSGPAALTVAERRVAELAGAGLTNPEIASALFVTINTVEGHLRHVYQKLSIHSRRQLTEVLDDVAA